jgi:hypothetical protein
MGCVFFKEQISEGGITLERKSINGLMGYIEPIKPSKFVIHIAEKAILTPYG